MTHYTDADLDAMEVQTEAATEGPWTTGRAASHLIDSVVYGKPRQPAFGRADALTHVCDTEMNCNETEPNAAFIAAARTAVPNLIADLKAARKVVEAVASIEPMIPYVGSFESDMLDLFQRKGAELRAALDEYDRGES